MIKKTPGCGIYSLFIVDRVQEIWMITFNKVYICIHDLP